MKAAAINAHGSLDQVQLLDVDTPAPARGEVLLQVKAAALNHLDIWVTKGRPGLALEFPHVIGSDAAGTVVALGEGVDEVEVGDEVILNPGLFCGACEFCRRGEQSECTQCGILGLSRWGAFAEQTAVRAENLCLKPAHLSFEEAAALPLAHLTAWRMLMSRAQLRPGETVLIHGIGGGVALAALQFASRVGAEVIVTSSCAGKLDRARDLGAQHTVNYRAEDVAQAVLKHTGGRGVDVIVDAVGAATMATNLAVARKGGRIVHCGVTTGAQAEINLSALYWKQLSVLGSTMGSQQDFRQMVAFVGITGLKPVIDRVYPLGQAREALERMNAGEQFGKIVLTP
ncbi:MAG: zinc-binding dehydrogenase [Candidatus Hydrogenedentes bacterium]|nr:zinc-binding dehydrogenase [Candidatus Hydrogenedentota bacterium]